MAKPDRYYGPLFDKIAGRQFWARGEAERFERSEDEKQAKACFSQSLQLCQSLRAPGSEPDMCRVGMLLEAGGQ